MENQEANEFKKNCLKLFADKIIYELKPFEEERQKTYKECKKYVISFVVALLISIAVLIYFMIVKVSKEYELIFSLYLWIDAFILVWLFMTPFWISKAFEKKIKKKIMPSIFKNSENFKWQEKSELPSSVIEKSKLFYAFGIREDDDCFKGNYKDVNIDICETKLTINNKDSAFFTGVLIYISLPETYYEGHTLIKQGKLKTIRRVVRDVIDHVDTGNLQKVNLEDIDFEKNFNVYSTDQIEARYIFTTAFMERFKKLAFAFKTDKIEAAFNENHVLLALYTNKDLFKLANVTKPIYNYNQYKTMIEEFASVLELVDELKLNRRLGL